MRVRILVVTPNDAQHPVVATFRLQAEQRTDAWPLAAEIIDASAKAAEADVLDHPALGRALLAQTRHIAGKHRETVIKPAQHGNPRFHGVPRVLALRRLGRPIAGQVAQHRQ